MRLLRLETCPSYFYGNDFGEHAPDRPFGRAQSAHICYIRYTSTCSRSWRPSDVWSLLTDQVSRAQCLVYLAMLGAFNGARVPPAPLRSHSIICISCIQCTLYAKFRVRTRKSNNKLDVRLQVGEHTYRRARNCGRRLLMCSMMFTYICAYPLYITACAPSQARASGWRARAELCTSFARTSDEPARLRALLAGVLSLSRSHGRGGSDRNGGYPKIT
eukprot:6199429-Pleurochrysis_carterae.AAC.1